MFTQQIQQQYSIRVGGDVVVVHKISFYYSRVTSWGGTATNVPTKIYCSVLLCTTNKSGAGREIQQQYINDVPPKMYCCCVLLCATNKSGGGRAMYVRTANTAAAACSTRRAECCTGVVHKISFFVHESHPGVVLLLMYQQKCTAVCCCVQPTRPAAGERRWASKKVIHTGSGISYVQR